MTPKCRIIPIFIPNAGCTHECVFCDQRRISGAAAPVNAEEVKSIIDSSLRRLNKQPKAALRSITTETAINEADGPDTVPNPPEIAFYGGSFTALPVHKQSELLEAAQPFLRLNQISSIRVSTRPDCIDKHTVDRLIEYGVRTIELGAQSMSDDVLNASHRGHASSDLPRSVDIIKMAGLSLILQMMTGLPGDDRDKSMGTARQFAGLKPDGVRIYPTVVVRGTKLHEMWLNGEYKEHTLQEAVGLCAELCVIFEKADIPVIRLGLNPTETLSAADAVAGAYHPALGELVYSRVYYEKAAALLDGAAPGGDVIFTVAKGRTSMMAGHGRQNIKGLKEAYKLRSIKIIESNELASTGSVIQLQINSRGLAENNKKIEKPW